jgi:hypothetical protein
MKYSLNLSTRFHLFPWYETVPSIDARHYCVRPQSRLPCLLELRPEAPSVRLCGNGPGWPITGLTVAGSAHSTGRGHLHSRERRTVDHERTSRIK